MTRVVHIQYSTNSAGSAALRLQNAFIRANIESCIISLQANSVNGIDCIKNVGAVSRVIAKIDTKIQSFLTRNKINKFGIFSYPILGTNVSHLEEVRKADIIYVHWALGGFLNFRSLKQLAQLNKPVIFFMHDMWACTGGCHYSFTCEKYKIGCNDCQMFLGQKKNDLSVKESYKKNKLYTKFDNLYFITPSLWLYECAKHSILTKEKSIFYIPNLLDETIFKPFDKNIARQVLNVEQDEFIIAFGAVLIDSPYKGWSYLQKALNILKQDKNLPKISVLIFGNGYSKEIADAIPFKTNFIGYLNDSYSTALVYNAASVIIVPSLAETFGYVVLEASSCGTPVVCFNIGGIPDIIKHKKNGYLAKYMDAHNLSEGIKFCIENNIQGKRLPIFDSSEVIKKHIDLINSLTNNI